VEHGFGGEAGDDGRVGTVATEVLRVAGRLHITVIDDGRGLPADFDPLSSGSLGLSIVRTLVESELGGAISLGASADGGTRVDIDVPLHSGPGLPA